jgi:hypothetical protein
LMMSVKWEMVSTHVRSRRRLQDALTSRTEKRKKFIEVPSNLTRPKITYPGPTWPNLTSLTYWYSKCHLL